ncbi:MAG: CotH kinase family protein [Planctomycetota bacterium]
MVVYNNFVARYIPNGRSNHVLLTLNGQEWGVYVNVQQYNKDLLRDYFDDETGMRVKCANNPNGGPALCRREFEPVQRL